MMARPNPQDRYYSRDHEWLIYYSDGTALIGITDYAQEMLTDIVFVDLPEIGRRVVQHATVAVIESVKSVSDVFAPVSGEVIEVNSRLEDTPELINQDAFGEGWIVKMIVEDPEEINMLLTATDYEDLLREEKE